VPLVLDIEVFPDLFLVSFLDLETGRVVSVYTRDVPLDYDQRKAVAGTLRYHMTIGFNSRNFDLPILTLALQGANVTALKALSDAIIGSKLPAWKITKARGIEVPKIWDHIDVIDVAPGIASLKLYAARLGLRHIQDLPYEALLRAETIRRDNHTCRSCGRRDPHLTPLVWDGKCLALPEDGFPAIYAQHEYSWRVDHIVPIAEGGAQFDPANLQLLCPECDRRKTSEDLSRILGRPSPLGLRKLEEFA